MLCLGIETSCDETAFALVEDGRLLGERMASQVDVHTLFGGVVPELASREHLRLAGPLLDSLFSDLGRDLREVDVVAVARGPGLLGSLLVGLSLAKGLALGLGAGLIGVNHLHAHLLVSGLEQEIPFPAMGLLVSGGHTHIYLIRSVTDFDLLGRTLDDAAGEAFDKAAKILNLPYPGGKYIDALARTAEADREMFPRPYLDNRSLDFSFSGLKTAVANYVTARPHLRLPYMEDTGEPGQAGLETLLGHGAGDELAVVCASLNFAVADTLRIKLERALDRENGIRSLVVAGGVAANTMVRQAMVGLAERRGLPLLLPRPDLCTDNGAMVAYLGYELSRAGWRHDFRLEAIPRGRIVPVDFLRA